MMGFFEANPSNLGDRISNEQMFRKSKLSERLQNMDCNINEPISDSITYLNHFRLKLLQQKTVIG